MNIMPSTDHFDIFSDTYNFLITTIEKLNLRISRQPKLKKIYLKKKKKSLIEHVIWFSCFLFYLEPPFQCWVNRVWDCLSLAPNCQNTAHFAQIPLSFMFRPLSSFLFGNFVEAICRNSWVNTSRHVVALSTFFQRTLTEGKWKVTLCWHLYWFHTFLD